MTRVLGLSLEKMDDLFGVTEVVKTMEAEGHTAEEKTQQKTTTIPV